MERVERGEKKYIYVSNILGKKKQRKKKKEKKKKLTEQNVNYLAGIDC